MTLKGKLITERKKKRYAQFSIKLLNTLKTSELNCTYLYDHFSHMP